MLYYGLEWHSLDSYFQFKEISAPVTPPANEIRLYAKDSSGVSTLCYKNDAGSEVCFPTSGAFVTGSGAAGRVAFWDTASSLSSDSDLTFATDTLTATKIVIPTSATFSFLTAGSVPFAGAAGLLSQDNAKLFWDNTNKFLGIGYNAPKTELNVHSTQGVGTSRGLSNSNYTSDAAGPQFRLVKGRGTIGGVTSVLNAADQIGSILFGGTNNTADGVNQGAQIAAITGSLWSSSNTEGILSFYTVPNASTTLTERFRIGSAGQWGIGGATFGGSGDIFSSGGASAAPTWVTRATLNAALDHGTLSGLTDDDHAGYALLAGRAGGQVLIGGTAASETLRLASTSNGTKGKVILGGSTTNQRVVYDEVNRRLGINDDSPETPLHVRSDGAQGFIALDSWVSSAAATVYIGRNSRGTRASPSASQSGDPLFEFQASGGLSTGFTGTIATLGFNATENFTSTNQGTEFILQTTPNGSTTATRRLVVRQDGAIEATTDAYYKMVEKSTTPSNPASSTELHFYMRADKFIIQFNDAGTVRYKYLDLTGTGVTWTHTTTAPT